MTFKFFTAKEFTPISPMCPNAKGLGLLVESHDRWTETGRRTDVAVVAGLVGGVAQHERKRLVDDL